MKKLPLFASFPHYFVETLGMDKYASVFCLNTVSGNIERFIKRNVRARVIANTFFPGAHQINLASIENDQFLLSRIDLRKIYNLASRIESNPRKAQLVEKNRITLPESVWTFLEECKMISLSSETIYHRANLLYLLWQVAKYYANLTVNPNNKIAQAQNLGSVVSFYAGEMRNHFCSNREVNEAHFRMMPEECALISASILIVDLPPARGYFRLPNHILVRELVAEPAFSLESSFPAETHLGSCFGSTEAFLGFLFCFLDFCEHIPYWVIILRESGIKEPLMKLLAERNRKNSLVEHAIARDTVFTYLVSHKG